MRTALSILKTRADEISALVVDGTEVLATMMAAAQKAADTAQQLTSDAINEAASGVGAMRHRTRKRFGALGGVLEFPSNDLNVLRRAVAAVQKV